VRAGERDARRKRILKAFGAEVVFTDPMEGSDGAIIKAKAMYAETPELYFYPDQYNNPGTGARTTTPRGPRSSSRRRGASPTSSPGWARAGRSWAWAPVPRGQAVDPLTSVQPDSPLHGLEGLKHMETAIVPGIYDPALADEDLGVGTEEAFDYTRRLAKQGLFVGISSGANLAGALNVARRDSGCGGGGDLL
jgi:cysteine synthase B